MENEKIIADEATYNKVMSAIDSLMAKGSENISEAELNELKSLALAAQQYEHKLYKIPPPSTLEGLIELKMFEMRIKQKELARKLGLSDAKLSLILSGKQKPDVAFLKAVHKELSIDANQLLELV
jgi:HTH-type transcriptional regulator / antitoxin HigA